MLINTWDFTKFNTSHMIMSIISEKKPEVTHRVLQSTVRTLQHLYLAFKFSQTADNCQYCHSNHEQINETPVWLYSNQEQLQQTRTLQLSQELLILEDNLRKGRQANCCNLKYGLPEGLVTSGSSSLLHKWTSGIVGSCFLHLPWVRRHRMED